MRSRSFALGAPLILAAAPLLACPFCKETVEEDAAAVGAGFSLSVLVMLGTVFALAGFLVLLFLRAARGADELTAADTPGPRGPSVAPRARSR
ncbi:MAG: hypothetical protein ACRD2T_16470 [Thermoanaerobaculia bacterium]